MHFPKHTKLPELRFHAVLGDGAREVSFERLLTRGRTFGEQQAEYRCPRAFVKVSGLAEGVFSEVRKRGVLPAISFPAR